MRKHALDMSSVDVTSTSVHEYDCVVLTTDHDAFDYPMIEQNAKLIVDTRGRFDLTKTNVIGA